MKQIMITGLAACIAAIFWTTGPSSDSTQVARAQAVVTQPATVVDDSLYELTLPEAVITAPVRIDSEIVLPEVVIKAAKKVGA